jgi:hypothetical protein
MKKVEPVRRAVPRRVVVKVLFSDDAAYVDKGVIHLSLKRQDVAEWRAEGAKIVAIEFEPDRGCPVTGFYWAEPARICSGPVSDKAKTGVPHKYTLYVKKGRTLHVIDPMMIPDV